MLHGSLVTLQQLVADKHPQRGTYRLLGASYLKNGLDEAMYNEESIGDMGSRQGPPLLGLFLEYGRDDFSTKSTQLIPARREVFLFNMLENIVLQGCGAVVRVGQHCLQLALLVIGDGKGAVDVVSIIADAPPFSLTVFAVLKVEHAFTIYLMGFRGRWRISRTNSMRVYPAPYNVLKRLY